MDANDAVRNRSEPAPSSEKSVPVDDALDRFAVILQSANADPRLIYDELFALAIANGSQSQLQPHSQQQQRASSEQTVNGERGPSNEHLRTSNNDQRNANTVCTDQHTIARLLAFVLENRLSAAQLLKVVSKLQVSTESIVRNAFRFSEPSVKQRVLFDTDDFRLTAKLVEHVLSVTPAEPVVTTSASLQYGAPLSPQYWDGSQPRLQPGVARQSVIFVHPALFVRRSRDAFLRCLAAHAHVPPSAVRVMKLRRIDTPHQHSASVHPQVNQNHPAYTAGHHPAYAGPGGAPNHAQFTSHGNVGAPLPPRQRGPSYEATYMNVSELNNDYQQRRTAPKRAVWTVDAEWFASECGRLRASGTHRPLLAIFCVGAPDAACAAFDDSARLPTLVRVAAHYGCWSHVYGAKTALVALLQHALSASAGTDNQMSSTAQSSSEVLPNSIGVSLSRVLNDAFMPDCVIIREPDSSQSRNPKLERSLSECGFERELETLADFDIAVRRLSATNRLKRLTPTESDASTVEMERVSVVEPRTHENDSLTMRVADARLKTKLARRFSPLFEAWLSLAHAPVTTSLIERVARRFESMRYLEAKLSRCDELLLFGVTPVRRAPTRQPTASTSVSVSPNAPPKNEPGTEDETVIEARSLGELFSSLTQMVIGRPPPKPASPKPPNSAQPSPQPAMPRFSAATIFYEVLSLYPASVTFKFVHPRMTVANRDTLNRWLFETLRRGGALHGGVPIRLINVHDDCFSLADEGLQEGAERVWFTGNFFHFDAFELGDWNGLEKHAPLPSAQKPTQRGAPVAPQSEGERAVRQLDAFSDALEQNCAILSYTQSQKDTFTREVERSGCMKVYETASPDWPGLGCVLYVVRKLRAADAASPAAANAGQQPHTKPRSSEPGWSTTESGYRTETGSLASGEQPGVTPTGINAAYDWKTAGYIQMTESDLEYSNVVTREIVARLRRHDKAYSLGVTYLRSSVKQSPPDGENAPDSATNEQEEQEQADSAQQDQPAAAAQAASASAADTNSEPADADGDGEGEKKSETGEETGTDVVTHQLFYIRFGLILAGSNVLDVVDAVRAVGQEIEAHHEYLRTMSDRVLEGIRTAERQLDEEYVNTIREEGVLRNLPVIGSMINWWNPLPSREQRMKGRSLDLQSGRMASTDFLLAGTKRGGDLLGENSRMKVHGGAANADTVSISSGDVDYERSSIIPMSRMWHTGAATAAGAQLTDTE